MDILPVIVGILLTVTVALFISTDTKKRGMSRAWILLSLLGLIGWLIYLIARKPIVSDTNFQYQVNNVSNSPIPDAFKEVIIPDSCPHCKSPNSKKIRLCEWCGNQIV